MDLKKAKAQKTSQAKKAKVQEEIGLKMVKAQKKCQN
jgi:hypothetical protein